MKMKNSGSFSPMHRSFVGVGMEIGRVLWECEGCPELPQYTECLHIFFQGRFERKLHSLLHQSDSQKHVPHVGYSEADTGNSVSLRLSLGYILSSKLARVTEGHSVSKTNKIYQPTQLKIILYLFSDILELFPFTKFG